MNLNEFINNVLVSYEARRNDKTQVIDHVFYFIEHDREYLKQYLDILANEQYSLQYVNSRIAQGIAKYYGLSSIDSGHAPESKLIQSYSGLYNQNLEMVETKSNLEGVNQPSANSVQNNFSNT